VLLRRGRQTSDCKGRCCAEVNDRDAAGRHVDADCIRGATVVGSRSARGFACTKSHCPNVRASDSRDIASGAGSSTCYVKWAKIEPPATNRRSSESSEPRANGQPRLPGVAGKIEPNSNE
jgi:hypothetical protein